MSVIFFLLLREVYQLFQFLLRVRVEYAVDAQVIGLMLDLHPALGDRADSERNPARLRQSRGFDREVSANIFVPGADTDVKLKFRQSSTPLRERFREDLTLYKFAPRTVERYLDAAIIFVVYFNRPPQLISDDEIRAYLRYQSETRRLPSGSMWIIHGMLKCLYTKALRDERPVRDIFRNPKGIRIG